MTTKLVNVVHPGVQHSYRLALALQKAGLLNRFTTSLYYKQKDFPYNFFRLLPPVEKLLKRRCLNELPAEKIIQFPWFEIPRLFLERAGIPLKAREALVDLCDRGMDRYAGGHLDKNAAATVGFSGSCSETFRRAKECGILCVLDQPTAHIDYIRKIFFEETNLHPEFARTIHPSFRDNRWCERRRRELSLADGVLCGSNFVKQTLSEFGLEEKRVEVIPYGADLERFRKLDGDSLIERRREFCVLFVGAIGQGKGIKYLLEAVKQLKLKDFRLKLLGHFVGSTEAYRAYQDCFEHIARVPNVEMPNYYQAADVLILPSLTEGLSMTILEAMASGLPVIVSENTGGRDVVEDGRDGFVIPIRSVDAIKEKILLLYENRGLCRAMGEEARRKAERFSWDKYYERIGNFFRELLS